MAQGGLGALDEGLAHIGDAEGGLVGRDDVVVDDGVEMEGDVVLGHAGLLGHFGNLDLDVDLDESLAEGVDLDEARVDGLVELAKLGDEADMTLADGLVGVGERTAGDGADSSDADAQPIDLR